MSKRKTVQDNFEAVYLRENCAVKAFANKEALRKLSHHKKFAEQISRESQSEIEFETAMDKQRRIT